MKSFGQAVKELRDAYSLAIYVVTGDDMAVKSRQHWQPIERGKKNINITTAVKIARTLDTDIGDLLVNFKV